jgi:hypothetical protein
MSVVTNIVSVGRFAEADDRIVVGVHTTCTSGIVTIHIEKQVEVQYGIWQGYLF